MRTALLIIDVQEALMAAKPYGAENFIKLLEEDLSKARRLGMPIIYVRHLNSDLQKGSEGWQIDSRIAPLEDEVIIEKTYNSAFRETVLKAYLDEKGIDKLIITGMQTNYCIDTTVKVAFEFGYKVAIIEGGTTTVDAPDISADVLIEYYENLWADCFGQVDSFENIIKED